MTDSKNTGLTVPCQVLIVDDHPAVREGLALCINQQEDLQVCGEATNSQEALQQIKSAKPDVVVIDLGLGKDSGLALVKRITSERLPVNILVWSAHPDSLYAERALAAGALGYINKALTTGQMLKAIRSVRNGTLYLSPEETDRLLKLKFRGKTDQGTDSIESLSNRELEVFRLLGKGHSTSEIAASLQVSSNTIETHRQRIKTKLGIKNAAELILRAVQWSMESSS